MAGTLTNRVSDIPPVSYQGATRVAGGFGFTKYGGALDIRQAGDGTVSWVAIRGALPMMRYATRSPTAFDATGPEGFP